MPIYTYTGPLTAMTLYDGREVVLTDGCTVDLPDCDITRTLVAMGRLTEQPEPSKPSDKLKSDKE